MSVVDVFYAPRGFAFDDFDTHDVSLPGGDTVTLRFPRLDAGMVHTLADSVRQHRDATLARYSTDRIVDVIARAAELWTNPQYPERRLAERLIPAITGYDASMVRLELKRYMRMFRRRELLRFVDDELDCPQMLDEYRPNRSGGYTRLYGPELSFHVFSSNVPGIPVWSMTMSLLVKSAVLGKSSFDEPLMPVLFARSLGSVDPDMADALAIMPWHGGTTDLEDAAIGEADAVIAYGSSHTTEAIRPRVRAGKPFLSYGAKIGFSLIGRESLRTDLYTDTVHRMAVDVATYDQQSCLAPQTMFVERGGAVPPAQVAELLACELSSQQRKYPCSTPSEEESMAIQRLRSTAQMKALLGAGSMAGAADGASDDPFVIQSRSGTDWTVLYYPSVDMADSLSTPLNRTVNIVAVDHIEDALPSLRPYAQWLQTCGVALGPNRLFDVAQRVGSAGIDRICPLGEMNRAKSGWHHDGGFNLLDLVHVVDIERNTDMYCDGFDMDVE